jgi:cytochrome d ubiquinol oxidase subunit II
MMLANVIVAIIWLGISAYAVFGGADFGAGIWDLVAGGPERGRRPRSRIERTIGPVWEANHVWLIFILVYLWTAFPEAFVSIATTLWIPLSLAAVGIIIRGSGFAFRKWAETTESKRFYGAGFAGASVITPFFLGAVVGGVASGRVPLGNAEGDVVTSWVNPTSMLGGVMAVVACAYMAAVLLTRDAAADGEIDLAAYFRSRALISGAAAGAIALAGIFVLRVDAPFLFDGLLTPRGVILMTLSGIGGIASLTLVWRRNDDWARPVAALAIVAVLWGWGAGQYPWILEQEATIADSVAPDAVLWALIVAFLLAAALAVPALLWLFRLTQGGALGETGTTRSDSTDALIATLIAEDQGRP